MHLFSPARLVKNFKNNNLVASDKLKNIVNNLKSTLRLPKPQVVSESLREVSRPPILYYASPRNSSSNDNFFQKPHNLLVLLAAILALSGGSYALYRYLFDKPKSDNKNKNNDEFNLQQEIKLQ